ncbi:uncharacterized protein IWZ02DRAFT_241496 [Phyllosticta citriasiana]|uniref:Zinc finger Mcm10/DnaG-type domain-containing protein n=1 Tax=Phyllosticta citriasiana TaxID=595635 RepID=A0ABR1KRQ8_9PEZI
MIVRESAMSHAPSRNQPEWPPRSPYQALMSSPSGRQKWQQRQLEQLSPSPSPAKRGSRASQLLSDGVDAGDDEDEDEETLQLKLQAIEARLKLKKLQASKSKQPTEQQTVDDNRYGMFSPSSRAGRGNASVPTASTRSEPAVQVPLSPTPDRRAAPNAISPAKLLGIDKGLRAQDVSLKRPAVPKFNPSAPRAGSASGHSRTSSMASQNSAPNFPRPKSFSERLAESRSKSNEKQAKDERIEKARTRGFGLSAAEMALPGEELRPSSQHSNESASRSFESRPKSILKDPTRNAKSTETGNNSFASITTGSRPVSRQAPPQKPSDSKTTERPKSFSGFVEKASALEQNDAAKEKECFETFSGFHLSRRQLSHNILARAFDKKELFPLPRLLSTVKSPDYQSPDVEADYVVLGIISSKTTPRDSRNAHRTASGAEPENGGPNKSKFMVLRLTDFKWEVDLFLFEEAFSRFWKLTPGTVIAILNPGIMPPRDKANGHFSLKLNSTDDTILELGTARDLGFCKSIKADGQQCSHWIDQRKTEFCDFHIYLQLEKTKRGRMEVNTMTGFGKGPRSSRFDSSKKEDSGQGKRYDKYLKETMYIVPDGRSTADKLDHDEDAWNRGMSREELHRKRLAEKERERELAEKLGKLGNKVGSDYMRLRGANSAASNHNNSQDRPRPSSATSALSTTQQNAAAAQTRPRSRTNTPFDDPFVTAGAEYRDAPPSPDAAALGLLGKRAADVSLAPVKRKRAAGATASAKSASVSTSTQRAGPMGWGGANKRGLLFSPSKTRPAGDANGSGRVDEMLALRRGSSKEIASAYAAAAKATNSSAAVSGEREKPALKIATDEASVSSFDSQSQSPVKKKARLVIEGKGIREPGRDSLGVAAGKRLLFAAGGPSAGDTDDDDDLEII